MARRNHRLCRRFPRAQCRFPGRIRRPPHHPQIPRLARAGAPQHLPHPHQRPRHQPRQRRHGRHESRHRPLSRRRRHRRGRSHREGRRTPGSPRCPHGHLPEHPRRLRGNHRRDLRVDSRPRRTGLHGRCQHERPGRPHFPRSHRRRRLPSQSPQDLLHPARRRRPRHGPHRRRRPPRAVPARHRTPVAPINAPARSPPPPSAAPASSPSPGCTSA